MKKLLLAVLVCIFAVSGSYAALTALHIHTASQGVITLLIADHPTLKFNDDRTLTVTKNDNPNDDPIVLSFEDIDKCEYGDTNDYVNQDGVSETISTTNIALSFVPEGVKFDNIPADACVEVYNISGQLKTVGHPAEGSYTLARETAGHGIYIVRIAGFVVKVSI